MAAGGKRQGTGRGGKAKAKLFHKIKDVCELTSTEPYVLRYWEQEFPFLAPEKNKAGHRIYTDDDIELVRRIKKLLYEEGYTTAGARRQLEKERAGTEEAAAAEGASESPEPAADSAELEALRSENESLKEQVGRLEADRGRLIESLKALRADAAALRQLVAGDAGGTGRSSASVRPAAASRTAAAKKPAAKKATSKSGGTASGRKKTPAASKKRTTRKR